MAWRESWKSRPFPPAHGLALGALGLGLLMLVVEASLVTSLVLDGAFHVSVARLFGFAATHAALVADAPVPFRARRRDLIEPALQLGLWTPFAWLLAAAGLARAERPSDCCRTASSRSSWTPKRGRLERRQATVAS